MNTNFERETEMLTCLKSRSMKKKELKFRWSAHFFKGYDSRRKIMRLVNKLHRWHLDYKDHQFQAVNAHLYNLYRLSVRNVIK